MKILVYGAGPLGSLFAAQLQQGGQDVSILARGQRLADLREHGIILEDDQTHRQTVTRVPVVESLSPEDAYDLVLVIMRKNRVPDILPILAANRHTPYVLFLMNNAAGPEQLVNALGRDRVLIGFPAAAGYREGPVIHYWAIDEKRAIPIGEVDGQISERTRRVADALKTMPGFDVKIRPDMDAWLKTHVAILMTAAPALYAAGTDNYRLARTRDGLVLSIRAVREGLRVLHMLGIPITPTAFRIIEWLPEPLLVAMLGPLLKMPVMRVALVGHALAARDELKHLADEFRALARMTTVRTEAVDCLYAYLDPSMPLMPEGSAKLAIDWRGTVIGLGAILFGSLWLLSRRTAKRDTTHDWVVHPDGRSWF